MTSSTNNVRQIFLKGEKKVICNSYQESITCFTLMSGPIHETRLPDSFSARSSPAALSASEANKKTLLHVICRFFSSNLRSMMSVRCLCTNHQRKIWRCRSDKFRHMCVSCLLGFSIRLCNDTVVSMCRVCSRTVGGVLNGKKGS